MNYRSKVSDARSMLDTSKIAHFLTSVNALANMN